MDVQTRHIEIFQRQAGNEWLLHDYAGEATCHFATVKLTLPLETVFEDVGPIAA